MRGLHFQKPPQAEAKLVKCIRGRVWDVGVDLRPHSSTFLKWQAVELDSGTHNAFFIPEGCAHGFQVMEPDSELLYLHSAFYHAEQEGGLLWNDPVLNISWPLPCCGYFRSRSNSSDNQGYQDGCKIVCDGPVYPYRQRIVKLLR